MSYKFIFKIIHVNNPSLYLKSDFNKYLNVMIILRIKLVIFFLTFSYGTLLCA